MPTPDYASPSTPVCHRRITPLHFLLAGLAFLVAATLLFQFTYRALNPSDPRATLAFQTALAAPLGPVTAGIARHGQSCCMNFAAQCMPFALPFLLAAFASLLLPPTTLPLRVLRYTLWTFSLLLWCLSGIVPMILHSFS